MSRLRGGIMFEEIKQQVADVVEYSQSIPNPKVDLLIKEWAVAKEKFLMRFGGPIYEWPQEVEFSLDPVEKRRNVSEFVDTVSDVYHNSKLAVFIEDNIDTFFDNVVSKSDIKEIPKGMKLIKAFKHFEDNEQTLNKIQSIASQLIQENKIKGKLCFSVHPLDFLSSSENTYNWRSCHSLDGEFRAGNLSYMVDTATFMVYLKGEDDVRLNAFPYNMTWNSKKWRVLMHASENDELMFAGRQYPFSSKSGLDTVLNIYNNLMIQDNTYTYNKYSEWSNKYVDSTTDDLDLAHRYLCISRHLVELEEVITSGIYALNYNDVLNSTCYTYPYYTLLNIGHFHDINALKKHPIIVGGSVECLHCNCHPIELSETMMCPDCELKYGYEENDNYTHCTCCDTRLWVDDAYWVGDECLCQSCFETQAFVCDCCGDYYFNSEQHFVPGAPDEYGSYMCYYCYNDYLDKKEKK